jgi:hypothetical protein
MLAVIFYNVLIITIGFVPVRLTPDARAREQNNPNGALANVIVFSAPRAGGSVEGSSAMELGAVAREPTIVRVTKTNRRS